MLQIADPRLDAPPRLVGETAESLPAETIAAQKVVPRGTWRANCRLAQKKQVSAVVVSGEVLRDSDSPAGNAEFRNGLAEIVRAGVPVVILPSAGQTLSRLPAGVEVLEPAIEDGETVELADGRRIDFVPVDERGRITGSGSGSAAVTVGVWFADRRERRVPDSLASGRGDCDFVVPVGAFERTTIEPGGSEGATVHHPGPAFPGEAEHFGPAGVSLVRIGRGGRVDIEAVATSPLRREVLRLHSRPGADVLSEARREAARVADAVSRAGELELLVCEWRVTGFGAEHDRLRSESGRRELTAIADRELAGAASVAVRHRLRFRPDEDMLGDAADENPLLREYLFAVDRQFSGRRATAAERPEDLDEATWQDLLGELDPLEVAAVAREAGAEWFAAAGDYDGSNDFER